MNIKELRQKLAITQESLAYKLGVSVQTVQRWESGKNKPSPMALRVIKEVFGVEL